MTVVIGLSGKAGAGKNSAFHLARILLDPDDMGIVRKVALADAVKELARSMGWGGKKDDKGRRLLQLLGTEVARQCIDDEYWTKKAAEKVKKLGEQEHPPRVVFIPDVRFPNEVEMVRSLGGKVWRIRRPVIEHKQMQDQHASETALDDYKDWDAIVVANDMTELFEAVKREFERLGLS